VTPTGAGLDGTSKMSSVGTRAGYRIKCPDLVGRDEEIATCTQLVRAASSGGGAATVLISGEAGLGKSALLGRIVEIARSQGLRTLTTECLRPEMRRAFGPFADLWTTLPSDSKPVQDVVHTVSIDPTTRAPSEIDRYRVHAAFTRGIAQLAGDGATLLAIDDLQWADEATLELFAYLSRRLTESLVLIGSYRSEELRDRPGLRRMLSDVSRERTWELPLRPLTIVENTRALRLIFGSQLRIAPAMRDQLHARSAGNPLLLEEILRALHERGELRIVDGKWRMNDLTTVPLPRTVLDAVRERLDSLDPETRTAVSAGALIGERFTAALLQDVLAVTDEVLTRVLREASEAQIIHETDAARQPDVFAFQHPLVRDAIRDSLLQRERRVLHRKIAELLAARGEQDASALAYHFDQAGDREKALHFHLLAGDSAERHSAFAEALRHFERVVELAPDDDPRIAPLETDRIARVASFIGQCSTALRYLKDATRRFEVAGDRRGMARAVIGTRFAETQAGIYTPQLLERSLELLEPLGDTPELSAAHSFMALDLATTLDLEGARRHAERAVSVGRRAGSKWELAFALDRLAIVLASSGDFETGVPLQVEAIALADTTEAFAFQSLFMRNNLATVLALGGKGDKEHAAILEGRGALLQRYGNENPYQARLHELLSKPSWDDFLSVFDSYEGETIDWAHLGIHRAFIEVARDGPQHMIAIEPLRLRLLASESLANIEPATSHPAEVAIIAGNGALALEWLKPAIAHLDRPNLFAPLIPAVPIYGLLAARAVGDLTALMRWLDLAAWSDAPAHVLALGTVALTIRYAAIERAAVAGELDQAIDRLRDLVDERYSQEAQNAPLTSLLDLRYIELLLQRAAPADAVNATSALNRATRFWRDARASWFLEQLRARADAWSLRWPSDDTSGIHRELTRREHEIARLVAKGLTNRDIAAQLSLSVRTAESHVEQIRSKLGFRTRAQIASWVTARSAPRPN
jgi:DNA-binding CsgD family transcriptional regulator